MEQVSSTEFVCDTCGRMIDYGTGNVEGPATVIEYAPDELGKSLDVKLSVHEANAP